MAFDLQDEMNQEVFSEIKKISRKYSSRPEDNLKGRLAEQIISVEIILQKNDLNELCPSVSDMPVFDFQNQLIPLHYKFQQLQDQNEAEIDKVEYQILEVTYALIFAYLSEYRLRSNNLINTKMYEVIENFLSVGQWSGKDFIYAKDKMTYSVNHLIFIVIEDQYKKSPLSQIDQQSEKVDSFLAKTDAWESSLEQKIQVVKELEQRLEQNKLTYDFVLLSKGFQQLYDQKKIELKERRNGYAQFGTMLVCIPIAVIIVIIILILTGYEAKLSSLWFLALPITTLMLFLFYFTRVGLQHVRSVQSQMMQLELRMALCQFIHNYAEDSEKLHAKNSNGFEKFENIIFSPLVSSDDKIPTTFDGMEQLAKLVSEFRR